MRALVGRLFWQELGLPGMLSDPVPAEPVVSLREYYFQRVTWLDAGAHGVVSVRIRQGGEATAADGHEALLAGVREAVAGDVRSSVRTPATNSPFWQMSRAFDSRPAAPASAGTTHWPVRSSPPCRAN
ncbi:hypothetical protein [Streptomyces sp. NPDC007905]|uniref:hypothetical protein n=1 Tax=Streptomyces sp. NPDC007905 TaxID=3364788 RepID=UPI0036E80581